MISPAWHCLVINLDRSTARLAHISGQLGALNIAFERLAAIDGRDIDPDATPHFSRGEYERRHGKEPTPGEIGCFLSHIEAMRRFLATEASFCLVLEDDAALHGDIADVLRGLEECAGAWNIALLYGNYPALPQRLARIGRNHELVGYLARQTGGVAYAIDRHAAQVYLRRMLPMSLPFDVDFDRAWDFGIRFRGVLPFAAGTGGYPSDIGVIGRKFRWYRRLPTYAARGLCELKRYRHYLLTDPIWLASWRYRLGLSWRQACDSGAGLAAALRQARAHYIKDRRRTRAPAATEIASGFGRRIVAADDPPL